MFPRHGWIVDIEIEVVMGAVDVTSDQPPGGAADEDIGGKVLFGEDAAHANGGSETVDGCAGEPAGVFGGDNGGHRPGGG